MSNISTHAAFCVSHRGLGYGEFENSLSALKQAISEKADAVEFDILHTKDKKALVFHDKKLKRLAMGKNCPLKSKLKDLSFRDIQKNCRLKNGESIPTLREALEVFVGSKVRLFIEFKDRALDSDFSLIEEVFSHNPAQVFIVSFNKDNLAFVDRLRKSSSFYRQVRTVKLQKYGYFGSFSVFDVADAKYIHKAKVKHLQKAGKVVGVYTKDKASKIKKYLRKGVDFITTNRPFLCESIVSKKEFFED